MDKSSLRISFSLLNKSAISLSTTIGVSGSPLGPRPERDLATNLYFFSTPDSYQRRVQSPDQILTASRNVQHHYKRVIKAYAPPSGTPPKIDLATDLYWGCALATHYGEMGRSDSSELFSSLNT
jgi:hypothetical protein